MSAERLLRIVLLLQSRGTLSAGFIAREMSVSTRTIKRDMNALNSAGIPVYATRGPYGGWSLMEGYRSGLNGLTAAEALAIVVGRPHGLLANLGLDDPGDAPMLRVLAAVAPSARDRAEHARQRVHVDLSLWGQPIDTSAPTFPVLHEALWRDRLVEMRYGVARRQITIAPLGLVCKGSIWYLIAQSGPDFRTYRVSRIHDVTITDHTFRRPDNFDLAQHWRDIASNYTDTFPRNAVKLRLRGEALSRVSWVQAHSKTLSEPDADGWVEANLVLENEDNQLTVIRILGAEVLVLEPDQLRRKSAAAAQAFAAANTTKP